MGRRSKRLLGAPLAATQRSTPLGERCTLPERASLGSAAATSLLASAKARTREVFLSAFPERPGACCSDAALRLAACCCARARQGARRPGAHTATLAARSKAAQAAGTVRRNDAGASKLLGVRATVAAAVGQRPHHVVRRSGLLVAPLRLLARSACSPMILIICHALCSLQCLPYFLLTLVALLHSPALCPASW